MGVQVTVTPTPLPGLRVVTPDIHRDERGWFMESWNSVAFGFLGLRAHFGQDNISMSHDGVVRGLHFQAPPAEQTKLVRCVEGCILDVALDIRHGSPTFGKWHAETLSARNGLAMWIPPGFAHGFMALTEGATVAYKCDKHYSPALARGVRWNDPSLAIPWPEGATVSRADASWPTLAGLTKCFTYKE